jgi:ubiquinone/menaquinone biosynthesis C-methylase UbiE
MTVLPGLEAFGLDISRYALMHCEAETIGRLHLGDATDLPFPDNSFKAAISLNTIHNLGRDGCIRALQELQRVSGGRAFVQVDSYRTAEQKAVFEEWVLTAKFHDFPDGWNELFKQAGYTGDHYWTIIE